MTAPPRARSWLVSPAYDLLFLANLGWLVALLPGLYLAADGVPHVALWQLHFVTTPHRWITLFLVVLDPDRRDGRTGLFAFFAVVALAVVAGTYGLTGGFTCLLLIDYLWNGWHFAAQHSGVLRVYGRKAGDGPERVERYGLRLFIVYVIARTAGWTTGWLEEYPQYQSGLAALDLLALAIPAGLVAREALTGRRAAGKFVYLASVCGLYAALLGALHANHHPLVASLTTAAALFHATEYLGLVSHYAWGRRAAGSDGLFRRVAGRWGVYLVGYLLILGSFAALIHLRHDQRPPAWWMGLNLAVAFLHYGFDGMIWKLRRPETARALGAAPAAA